MLNHSNFPRNPTADLSAEAVMQQFGYVAYRSLDAWATLLQFRPNCPAYDLAVKSFARLSKLLLADAINIVPSYEQVGTSTEAICNVYYRLAGQSPLVYAALLPVQIEFLRNAVDLAVLEANSFLWEYLGLAEQFCSALDDMVGADRESRTYSVNSQILRELFQHMRGSCESAAIDALL